MKTHAITIVTAKALLGLSIAFGTITTPALHHTAAPANACHEDQPCWDCTSMGNGQCG